MRPLIVGYGFRPTDEELIYHLKNKIRGQEPLVDQVINVIIDICTHDPIELLKLSKIESDDLKWYFFSPREYNASDTKKKGTKRTTPYGFWKVTAGDKVIKDKRVGVDIGFKKTLVYHIGKAAKGVKTDLFMYEYHITSLPPHQSNYYVICKVVYKGDEGDSFFSDDNSNGLSHSTMMASDLNTVREINNTTPEDEQPLSEEDPYMYGDIFPTLTNEPYDFTQFNQDTSFNDMFDEDMDFDNIFGYEFKMLEENPSVHRPKKPNTGYLSGSDSESDDAESIYATSYQGSSSPESAHNLRKDSCNNIKNPAEIFINRKTRKPHLTRGTILSKQEEVLNCSYVDSLDACIQRLTKVKIRESNAVNASMDNKSSSFSMVKTEKKGPAMDRRIHKNPQHIDLMNMIIGFILLVDVVGNKISASKLEPTDEV